MKLWGRSRPKFHDRRNATRHAAVENRALLSWWVGGQCVEVAARVKDLGLMGASLAAEGQPPSGQPLWLRLEAPSPTDWVEVALAWVTTSGEVGVVFPGACPYDLYKLLVPGCIPDGRRPEAESPEFDARYWR